MYNKIKIQYPPYTNGDYSCLTWNLTQIYHHTEQPQVRVSLEMEPEACEQNDEISDYTWLLSLTIFFALCSFVLELF